MKDKIPFSTLLIAVGMKLVSAVLYKVADLAEEVKVLDALSGILNLCGKMFNFGFWVLIIIFALRMFMFILAKIRRNKTALKLQMTEEKAQAAKDKAAIEAAKQEVATTTDYMGRQAKGF